jgi:hypothetical protein
MGASMDDQFGVWIVRRSKNALVKTAADPGASGV